MGGGMVFDLKAMRRWML